MNRGRVLYHMVKADFLTRVRRYSFLLTVAFAVFLAFETLTGNIVLNMDGYRGIYNSAWTGELMALVATTFFTLAGFYIVRGSIRRDEETRVGRILAATPMSRAFYTMAKTISNFAVLTAMLLPMAVAALAMQLIEGEDRTLHLWPLLNPLLLYAWPAMAFVAALAVLFDVLPVLRGGVGNILYFFIWTALLVMGLPAPGHANRPGLLDFTGIGSSIVQMQAALWQVDPQAKRSFDLAIGNLAPHRRFLWTGLHWDWVRVAARLEWVAVAAVLALLAALFFHRFDPARERRLLRGARNLPRGSRNSQITVTNSLPPMQWTGTLTAPVRSGRGAQFIQLVAAELRLMLKGYPWWWYAAAAGLLIACLAAPLDASRSGLLLAAWLWPALLWSQMGTREIRYATTSLVTAGPRPLLRQLPAVWVAGVLIAMLTGGGVAIRLLLAGDAAGLAGWTAGALFIPSLALALGLWSGTSKLFEAVYVVWWYVGALHHQPGLDFTGTVPATSRPAIFLLAAVLLAVAGWFGQARRLAYR